MRRPFAGTQANDSAPDANTFAGLERDVTDQAVALVKQTKDGNTVRHRSDAGKRIGTIRRCPGLWQRTRVGGRRRWLIGLTIAGGQPQKEQCGSRDRADRRDQLRDAPPDHAASGVQA